ncbi:MAG: rod shape-determining protein MreD [Haliea sp.]|nr:rod shape-determining protein MreD [Haliea sp.]
MNANNALVFSVMAGSFLLAALLAVVQIPEWLQWARPEWVALTLLYWCIALPHRIGIFTALLLGLLIDALEGAVLGQNAFSLTVLALCALLLYQRLRVFSLWQQCAVVFVVIGLHQLVGQWVQNLEGSGARSLLFLLPAVSSALLWPMMLQVLRSVRRYYRIS